MGKVTGIEWCTHTWNPWRGCVEVSEGCDHCYAREMSKRNPRVLGTWGEGDEGVRAGASEAYLDAPFRWDREAAGLAPADRPRVFCGSLMDFFEDRYELVIHRDRAWRTMRICQNLNWLLLTKRPQYIRYMAPPFTPILTSWHNVWLGCTVENMRRAHERIDTLCAVPAHKHFLSCEPLLEPLDLVPWFKKGGIDWVIVGGESNQGGAQARPMDLNWVEEIVQDCHRYSVPCFVKQMGSRPLADGLGLMLRDRHGGAMEEWPDWLQVRQVPV